MHPAAHPGVGSGRGEMAQGMPGSRIRFSRTAPQRVAYAIALEAISSTGLDRARGLAQVLRSPTRRRRTT